MSAMSAGGDLNDSNAQPGLNTEGRLTPQAREAVRAYMLRLVAIPAALVTVVSGVSGFFLNKVAFQQGYQEAFQPAIHDITETADELGKDKGKVETALSEVKTADALATTAARDATKAANDASDTSEKAARFLTTNTESLAHALANTTTFQQAATTTIYPAFGNQKEVIAKIKKDLLDLKIKLTTAKLCRFIMPNNSWADSVTMPLGAVPLVCHDWAATILGPGPFRWQLGCINGATMTVSWGSELDWKESPSSPDDNSCGW